MTDVRRLWLIRHAQAADKLASGSDFDRDLTATGRRQAQRLRHWLDTRLQDHAAPRVLVSPARRTRATARLVLPPELQDQAVDERELWNARLGALTGLIDPDNPDAPDLLIIGHNPGLEQVQHALSRIMQPLPVAGAFELERNVEGRWSLVARFQPPSDSA